MLKFFQSLLLVAASVLVTLILCEGLLWFFPVSEVMGSLPVNDSNPVLRFVPNRDWVWSKFGTMEMVNNVHTNNYGFMNDQDYETIAGSPLVAVIGDSLIEALMVPYPETGQGRLAKVMNGRARVYSFARSGAPLSQYLAYADWVRENFNPRKMIFVVVGNDYDESLVKYKSAGGFHYFSEKGDGSLFLERRDYEPTLGVSLIPYSRLLLYALGNLQVMNAPASLRRVVAGDDGKQYAGQTDARAGAKRLADSKRAVDAFFELVDEATGLPRRDVLFVLDGIRPHAYDPAASRQARESYVGRMRDYFMKKATGGGYAVTDLHPAFVERYRHEGRPFEYPRDGHWNELGHEVFADEVLASGFLDEYRSGQQE